MRLADGARAAILLSSTIACCLVGTGIAKGELVGWWKLDEGSGGFAHDFSGHEHHGTLHGGPEWVPGVTGTALQFDGQDDYVYMGSVGISWIDSRTIVGWAKANTMDIQGGTSVFGFGGEGSYKTLYWDLEIDGYGNYALYMGASYSVPLISLDTEWHHFAITYDAPMGCACVDGQSLDCASAGSLIRTVDEVRIGGRLTNNHYFPGIIDDFRIYDTALTLDEIRSIMGGNKAYDPIPPDGAQLSGTDVELGWSQGNFAASHDVYLGDNFDEVNERTDAVFVGNQTDTSIVIGSPGAPYPDGLALGGTYYWRVDEVEADGLTKHVGDVWSFKAEPVGYPIESVIATTNAASESGAGIENTINGSGLDQGDHHSTKGTDMWLGAPSGSEPIRLQYDFDRLYKLHQMIVWNYNSQFEPMLGFGLKDVTVEYSTSGAAWTVLDDVEFSQATGKATYTPNTTVDFGGIPAQHVRLTVNAGYGSTGKFGLSEVRFLYLPVWSREPKPADGATDVTLETTLVWRAGRDTAIHEVYISTDELAVLDGTALADIVYDPTYSAGTFDLGTTYYWKVNEVNEAEIVQAWEGDVWSFSTQKYLVVDDFESYDDDVNLLYETWIDGETNGTGSTVGHPAPPFAEHSIVHGGLQSMPLSYANDLKYSEATRDLTPPADWNSGGVTNLSLWFRGRATNDPERLYVALNGTVAVYHDDPASVQETTWTQWVIPLQNFADLGVDLAKISMLSIGVGNRDNVSSRGWGMIYIDDIRLYPTTP